MMRKIILGLLLALCATYAVAQVPLPQTVDSPLVPSGLDVNGNFTSRQLSSTDIVSPFPATNSTSSVLLDYGQMTFALDDWNGFNVGSVVQVSATTDPTQRILCVVVTLDTTTGTINCNSLSGTRQGGQGIFNNFYLQVVGGTALQGVPPWAGLGIDGSTSLTNPANIGQIVNLTVQLGLAFSNLSTVYVWSPDDISTWFTANVISYNSGTGAISLAVKQTANTGLTYTTNYISMLDAAQSHIPQYQQVGLQVGVDLNNSSSLIVLAGAVRDSTGSIDLIGNYQTITGLTPTIVPLSGTISNAGTSVTGSGTSFTTTFGNNQVDIGVLPPYGHLTDFDNQLTALQTYFNNEFTGTLISASGTTDVVTVVGSNTALTTIYGLGSLSGVAYNRGGAIGHNINSSSDPAVLGIVLAYKSSDGTTAALLTSFTESGDPDLPSGYTFYRVIGIDRVYWNGSKYVHSIIQPMLPLNSMISLIGNTPNPDANTLMTGIFVTGAQQSTLSAATSSDISISGPPKINGSPIGWGSASVVGVNGVAYPASPSTNTVPVVTGANTITYEHVPLAAGGTNADLSATGAAHDVLRQSSGGAAITVGQLACGDLSDAGGGCTGAATPSLPLALASGGTHADLSATGAAHDVLKQSSLGANITVGQLACADLSDAGAGCSGAAGPALPLALASGGTHADLSGTGAAHNVLKQSSLGANITVGQLACADLSDGANGCSNAGANPSATAKDTAVNGSATTYMRSDAAPAIQKATSAQFGLVEVDNATITAAAGVITTANTTVNGTACTPGGTCAPPAPTHGLTPTAIWTGTITPTAVTGSVSSVDATNDIITWSTTHGLTTGQCIRGIGTVPAGWTAGQMYYVNALSGTTFALYNTLADALANTSRVNITATTTGATMVDLAYTNVLSVGFSTVAPICGKPGTTTQQWDLNLTTALATTIALVECVPTGMVDSGAAARGTWAQGAQPTITSTTLIQMDQTNQWGSTAGTVGGTWAQQGTNAESVRCKIWG